MTIKGTALRHAWRNRSTVTLPSSNLLCFALILQFIRYSLQSCRCVLIIKRLQSQRQRREFHNCPQAMRHIPMSRPRDNHQIAIRVHHREQQLQRHFPAKDILVRHDGKHVSKEQFLRSINYIDKSTQQNGDGVISLTRLTPLLKPQLLIITLPFLRINISPHHIMHH